MDFPGRAPEAVCRGGGAAGPGRGFPAHGLLARAAAANGPGNPRPRSRRRGFIGDGPVALARAARRRRLEAAVRPGQGAFRAFRGRRRAALRQAGRYGRRRGSHAEMSFARGLRNLRPMPRRGGVREAAARAAVFAKTGGGGEERAGAGFGCLRATLPARRTGQEAEAAALRKPGAGNGAARGLKGARRGEGARLTSLMGGERGIRAAQAIIQRGAGKGNRPRRNGAGSAAQEAGRRGREPRGEERRAEGARGRVRESARIWSSI
jgi:hypothetical protein